MIGQASLFDEQPRYCVDTNVIVSFLSKNDEEFYGSDVFAPQWRYIESLIDSGAMVAPREVEAELLGWQKTIDEMTDWIKAHRRMFVDVSASAQLRAVKAIVNAIPAYASSLNYVGDLSVMALAKYLDVPVVTLERKTKQTSWKHPKIPNVCEEFGIECLSVTGFFRREGLVN